MTTAHKKYGNNRVQRQFKIKQQLASEKASKQEAKINKEKSEVAGEATLNDLKKMLS